MTRAGTVTATPFRQFLAVLAGFVVFQITSWPVAALIDALLGPRFVRRGETDLVAMLAVLPCVVLPVPAGTLVALRIAKGRSLSMAALVGACVSLGFILVYATHGTREVLVPFLFVLVFLSMGCALGTGWVFARAGQRAERAAENRNR